MLKVKGSRNNYTNFYFNGNNLIINLGLVFSKVIINFFYSISTHKELSHASFLNIYFFNILIYIYKIFVNLLILLIESKNLLTLYQIFSHKPKSNIPFFFFFFDIQKLVINISKLFSLCSFSDNEKSRIFFSSTSNFLLVFFLQEL